MLACDTSVTTACACAKVNRAPRDASASRLGVGARPPYEPSASARSVSIVTSRMLRSAFGWTVKVRAPPHDSATAATSTTGDQEIRSVGENGAWPRSLLTSRSPDLL